MNQRHRSLASGTVMATALLLIATVAAQPVALPRRPGTINLDRQANVRIEGAAPGDNAGVSVARAGDVDGDGKPDLLVGAPGADNNGADSGSAYVVFDRVGLRRIDLAALGDRGFRIDGEDGHGAAGGSVAAAGDVNQDGRADLLIGASGSAYVVFGKSDPDLVNLAALGKGGFRIDDPTGAAGAAVAGVGDVNGDGRADVVLGAPGAGNNGRADSGSAFVVFGKSDPSTVDLGALGNEGFRIDGANGSSPTGTGENDPGDAAGASVAGAGDVNKDGRADLLVGAPGADNNGPESGSAYVVFGKADPARVDLRTLGQAGFRIDGAGGADLVDCFTGDFAGAAVAGAGDVNGDGRPDVVVGAPGADNPSGCVHEGNALGAAYVVFSKANPRNVDLGKLGHGGFKIDGADEDGLAGAVVAAAGDVNRDGRADVVVGAPVDFNDHLTYSGSAYLVFGKSSSRRVDLSRLRRDGVPLDGSAEGDLAGDSAASPGDVNQDARADLLVGAPRTDINAREDSGSAYVVYGPFKPDTTRPRLMPRARSPQRPLARTRVRVAARCNETCWLQASGTIKVLGRKERFRLARMAVWALANHSQTLDLDFSAITATRLGRLLKRGERARALIIVRGEDRAGNARTASLTVPLTR